MVNKVPSVIETAEYSITEGDKALYTIGTPPNKNVVIRHRMSKEVALEMLEEYGVFAHMHALEKLDVNQHKALWRDVLTWLDELTQGEKK